MSDITTALAKFNADYSARPGTPAEPQTAGDDVHSALAAFQRDHDGGSIMAPPDTRDMETKLADFLDRKIAQTKWQLTTPEGHAELTRAFISGIPTAARFGGALFSGGDPFASEAAGQAADLATESVQNKMADGEFKPENKPLAVRGGQAAVNIASQLPFMYRPAGFTPELEKYISTLPASGNLPGKIEDIAETGLRESQPTPSIYTEPSKLGVFAGNRAVRSANPNLGDTRKLSGRAQSPTELGQDWLEQGIVSSTPAKSAEKAAAQVETLGTKLGNSYRQLDQAAKGEGAPGAMPALEVKPFLEDLRQNVLEPMKNDPNFDTASAKLGQRLDRWQEIYGNQDHFTFQQLHTIRTQLDKTIDWKAVHLEQDRPFYNGLATDMRNAIQDKTLDAANAMSTALGQGMQGDEIRGINRQLSSAYMAKDLFDKATSRQYRNRMFSPSDYAATGIGAITGLSTGNPVAAAVPVVAGAAHHLARVYGNQVMAQGAYWAAKTAGMTPAAKAVLSDYASALVPQLGRIAAPDDIPQQVMNRIQAIDALEKQKDGLNPDQQRAIQHQQSRLKQRIAALGAQ